MDDKNNINGQDDDLDNLAPNLSRLGKNGPFEVPGDYFDDLASRIAEKCADADELRELAPALSEIPKYNPFTVPANYFEELPSIIQEKCIKSPARPSWISWLFRPRLAIAAAVLAAALAFFLTREWNDETRNNTTPVAMTDTLQNDTIISANEEIALYSVDESLLIESVSSEQVAQVDDKPKGNNTDIEDYLVENNIDVGSIVSEL
jgi:hypothetical protein